MIETSDFGVVAALGMHGIHPAEKKISERRVTFFFPDSDHVRGVLDEYESGRLTGSLTLFNTLVKNVAMSTRREVR